MWRGRQRHGSAARAAAAATPAGPRGASEPSCPPGRRKPAGEAGRSLFPAGGRATMAGRKEAGRRPGRDTGRRAWRRQGKGRGMVGKGDSSRRREWRGRGCPSRRGPGTGSGHSPALPCPALPGATGAPDTPSAGLRGHGQPARRPSAQAGARIIENTANYSQVMSHSQDRTVSFFFVQVTAF